MGTNFYRHNGWLISGVLSGNLQFLDSCTSLLNLPFAARRLFDENGNELFTLQSLKRDQIVFVTCGETWTDPKLTRKEQYRRLLLSQLSSDIEKIRQYCALRNPNSKHIPPVLKKFFFSFLIKKKKFGYVSIKTEMIRSSWSWFSLIIVKHQILWFQKYVCGAHFKEIIWVYMRNNIWISTALKICNDSYFCSVLNIFSLLCEYPKLIWCNILLSSQTWFYFCIFTRYLSSYIVDLFMNSNVYSC